MYLVKKLPTDQARYPQGDTMQIQSKTYSLTKQNETCYDVNS